MKKFAYILVVLFSMFYLTKVDCAETKVLVSLSPYKEIVEEIAGDYVEVCVLVPHNVSFHHYEASPHALMEAASCKIWFGIGDPFEQKIKQVFQERSPDVKFCDLRENLVLIHDAHHHGDEHDEGVDPHIWMSVRLMQQQVETMYKALVDVLVDKREQLFSKKEKLLEKLRALDQSIVERLQNKKGGTIFVAHPAYSYFCRDYDLSEVSIEQEGKEPGPRYITQLLQVAEKNHVKTIFAQSQHPVKAAYLIAKVVKADVVMLDPYAQDYFENMMHIAQAFDKAL